MRLGRDHFTNRKKRTNFSDFADCRSFSRIRGFRGFVLFCGFRGFRSFSRIRISRISRISFFFADFPGGISRISRMVRYFSPTNIWVCWRFDQTGFKPHGERFYKQKSRYLCGISTTIYIATILEMVELSVIFRARIFLVKIWVFCCPEMRRSVCGPVGRSVRKHFCPLQNSQTHHGATIFLEIVEFGLIFCHLRHPHRSGFKRDSRIFLGENASKKSRFFWGVHHFHPDYDKILKLWSNFWK